MQLLQQPQHLQRNTTALILIHPREACAHPSLPPHQHTGDDACTHILPLIGTGNDSAINSIRPFDLSEGQ